MNDSWYDNLKLDGCSFGLANIFLIWTAKICLNLIYSFGIIQHGLREGHVQGQQYISVTHKSYPYRTWELRSAHGAVRCDAMRRANKDPNSKKVNKIISLLHQEFMQRCGRVQPYSHIHIQFIWNMEHGHAFAFINVLGCAFTAIYVLFPPSTISYLPLLLPVFFLCISCVLVC